MTFSTRILHAFSTLVFALALVAGPFSRAGSQTYLAKDPALATLIGVLITGGGQMYSGKVSEGLMLLGGSAVAVLVGYNASAPPTNCSFNCNRNLTPAYIGIGVAGAAWLYGVLTAARDANDYNTRHGSLGSVRPLLDRRGDRTRIGLAFRR